jgi:hypothetical protein
MKGDREASTSTDRPSAPVSAHTPRFFAKNAAAHTQTVHSEGTHTAASHPTSHTRHGVNQAGNCTRQTTLASLTVPRAASVALGVACLAADEQ